MVPTMTDDQHRDYVQALFLQHHVPLRGFLTTLVVDTSFVDDIVQETFVTVSQKAASFTPGTDFRAWLWSVACEGQALACHACGIPTG